MATNRCTPFPPSPQAESTPQTIRCASRAIAHWISLQWIEKLATRALGVLLQLLVSTCWRGGEVRDASCCSAQHHAAAHLAVKICFSPSHMAAGPPSRRVGQLKKAAYALLPHPGLGPMLSLPTRGGLSVEGGLCLRSNASCVGGASPDHTWPPFARDHCDSGARETCWRCGQHHGIHAAPWWRRPGGVLGKRRAVKCSIGLASRRPRAFQCSVRRLTSLISTRAGVPGSELWGCSRIFIKRLTTTLFVLAFSIPVSHPACLSRTCRCEVVPSSLSIWSSGQCPATVSDCALSSCSVPHSVPIISASPPILCM